MGTTWGPLEEMSGVFSGASSGTCLGVIWGMSGASSGACLGESKISAVLHASLMPFF